MQQYDNRSGVTSNHVIHRQIIYIQNRTRVLVSYHESALITVCEIHFDHCVNGLNWSCLFVYLFSKLSLEESYGSNEDFT